MALLASRSKGSVVAGVLSFQGACAALNIYVRVATSSNNPTYKVPKHLVNRCDCTWAPMGCVKEDGSKADVYNSSHKGNGGAQPTRLPEGNQNVRVVTGLGMDF